MSRHVYEILHDTPNRSVSRRRIYVVQDSLVVRVRRRSDESAREMPSDEFASSVAIVRPALVTLAARLTSWDQADDVVQEALARAWVKRRLFDPRRGTLKAWLLAITADQARLERRRSSRRPLLGVSRDEPGSVSLDDAENPGVAKYVERLSPRQRLAVDCYYFADLSVAEVAAVMRCSEGTVKSTLADARARLRALIETDV